MATITSRRRREEPFHIHEDAPSTADTEMNEDPREEEDGDVEQEENAEGQQSEYDDSSEDEQVDGTVQEDMERLQDSFPGFREKYRLIKRIGEGLSYRLLQRRDNG